MKDKRVHHNTLDMAKRIRILDWLRAHKDELPSLSGQEIVAAVAETINHPCSLHQVRETAKAADMPWKIRKTMPKGETKYTKRINVLEARVTELEAWCINSAKALGLEPPNDPEPLPTDDEL